MSDSKELEKERNQQVRIQCIDYATRVVDKPDFTFKWSSGDLKTYQEDVTELAKQMYKFVTASE